MDDLCTACLCGGRNLYSINETSFHNIYRDILNEVPIYESPEICVRICWECRARLSKYREFKTQVQLSYKESKEYVEKKFHKLTLMRPSHLQIQAVDSFSYPNMSSDAIKIENNEIDIEIDIKSEVDLEIQCEPKAFVNDLQVDVEGSTRKKKNQEKTIKKKVGKSYSSTHSVKSEPLSEFESIVDYSEHVKRESETVTRVERDAHIEDKSKTEQTQEETVKENGVKEKKLTMKSVDANEKPQCVECGNMFSSRNNYRRHLKKICRLKLYLPAANAGLNSLGTVPALWEKKGTLRWPKRNGEVGGKRHENAPPHSDWQTFSCVVKRRNLLTHEEAGDELTRMLNQTDSDAEENENGGRSQIDTSTSQVGDFNSTAQSLISAGNSNTMQQLSRACDNCGIEACGQTKNIQSLPQLEHVNVNNTSNLDVRSSLVLIVENQNRIMKRLADISVQLSEIKDKTPVHATSADDKLYQTNKFTTDPINRVEDLEKLELQLSNPEIFSNLLEKYSILCSAVSGSGINCAYRLLDAFFTKDFLCKCSWTGGSRGADLKIGFKRYKNVLSFFLQMIRSWDCTYTMQNNEDFFKSVLRNALKRKETKNIRISSKKIKRTLNVSCADEENTNKEGEEK